MSEASMSWLSHLGATISGKNAGIPSETAVTNSSINYIQKPRQENTEQLPQIIYDVELDRKIEKIEGRLSLLEARANSRQSLKILRLPHFDLSTCLDIIVEPDDGGYLASSIDTGLFGFGDSIQDAVEKLRLEIESMYSDLMEDDDFSSEFLHLKSFLDSIIIVRT